MTQRVTEVVAAIIEHADGSFLLSQRPPGKAYEGYWEFPGGKVEPNEVITDALHRELREELGINIELAYPWITRVHSYPHATVRLHFFRVARWSGEPHPHERQVLSWQSHGELSVTPMLPANAPVLKALLLPTTMGITHAWESGIDAALKHLHLALARGMRFVQIREKNLDPVARKIFAGQVMKAVHAVDGIVVVNGDAQLSTMLGAGLHLPSRELMAAKSRPDVLWCGASCHDAIELEKARELGLDFAVLGPIKFTPSHADSEEMGWQRFAKLVREFSLPVYALGGLQTGDLDEARRHGGHGVAMVRGAWEWKEN